MSQPIFFMSHNKIKKARTDEFRKHCHDSVPPTIAGNTGILAQLAYENEETAEVTIVRFFADAGALDLQIEGADQWSKKTYELIEPIGIEIFCTYMA